jgi:AAA family ATP:ADP antiporter
VGGLAGPLLATTLARPLGPVNLLLVAAALLELATQCSLRLGGGGRPPAAAPLDAPLGGRIFAGITNVLRSRYLLGICLYMLLYATTSTVLYLEQQHLVERTVADSGERTALFAAIDLLVNTLTLLLQAFVAGRWMAGWGVGPALAVVPALTAGGFAALAAVPTVAAVAIFQGVRRAANYALARPAREVLFTVLAREDKYKAKSFIDTVVYRGGDAASGWAFAGLAAVGLSLPLIAVAAVPVSAAWLVVGVWLGRRQAGLAVESVVVVQEGAEAST